MKFKLEIDCSNAAFDDDRSGAVADILGNTAEAVVTWAWLGSIPLFDVNGNKVGRAWIEESE